MARRNSISRANLRAGLSRGKRALMRLEKYREAAKETMMQVLSAAEVGGTAFGFGWLKGRYGDTDVVGVPVDAGTAAVLHVLGFSGIMGRDLSKHAHNVANGALGSYLSDTGRKIGDKMAQEAGDKTSGYAIGGRRAKQALPQGAPRVPWATQAQHATAAR